MLQWACALLFLLAITAPLTVDAAVIPVAPGTPIQDAVDAAAPGDTLVLSPGVYPGAVVIDKPLRIKGKGVANIDPLGAAVGIEIAADDVRIAVQRAERDPATPGLVIGFDDSCPTDALLRVTGRRGIKIRDVHGGFCLTRPTVGFDITGVTDSLFRGILVGATDTGIRVRQLAEDANVTLFRVFAEGGVGALFEDIAPGAGRRGAKLVVNRGGYSNYIEPTGASLRFVGADGILVVGPLLQGDVDLDAQSDDNLIRGALLFYGTVNDAGSGNCVIRTAGVPDNCP